MLSEELRARIRAAVDRSRDRELNFQRVLPVVRCCCQKPVKPRIRVKATSHHGTFAVNSEIGGQ
jgi:hypothetical protein